MPHRPPIQSDRHFVILPAAGERSHVSSSILKYQLHRQIAGMLMVEVVDFATSVEAYTGDGKGDGVRNAALSDAHVSGDYIHIAELKCPAVRITLEATNGKPGHTKLFDRLNHGFPPFYAACAPPRSMIW